MAASIKHTSLLLHPSPPPPPAYENIARSFRNAPFRQISLINLTFTVFLPPREDKGGRRIEGGTQQPSKRNFRAPIYDTPCSNHPFSSPSTRRQLDRRQLRPFLPPVSNPHSPSPSTLRASGSNGVGWVARVPATFGRIVVESTDVQLGNDPFSKGREGRGIGSRFLENRRKRA